MGAQKPQAQKPFNKNQSGQKNNGKPSKDSKKKQNKITFTVIIVGISLLSSLYSIMVTILGSNSANILAQNPQLLTGF